MATLCKTISLGLLLSALAFAQAPLHPQHALTVQEILKRVAERAESEKTSNIDSRYGFSMLSIQEQLDNEGKVKEHTELQYETVLVEGHPYQKLVAKNGKPLFGKDLKKENDREKHFRKEIAQEQSRKNKDKRDSDEDDIDLSMSLFSAYQISLLGEESVAGRPSYKLSFLPKPGAKLPGHGWKNEILSRLEGQAWVDKEFFSVTRLDMHLTESTSFLLGLGSLNNLDVRFEQRALQEGIFMPAEMEIAFEARKLFSTVHVKQMDRYFDYKPFTRPIGISEQRGTQ
jgi:hypothetical protein